MLQSVMLATKGDIINYGAKIFFLTLNSISKMFLFFLMVILGNMENGFKTA